MKVTYIGHSGFLVELEETAFLFDYYQGEIPKVEEGKRLYVCVSHRHGDHFNPEIFKLAAKYSDVWYILSNDIWKSRIPQDCLGRTVSIRPKSKWEDGCIQVETLKSTDEGVAFLIQAEGKALYHGGDLNNWRWEGEAEESNRRMEEHFKQFLEPARGRKIDAAFVPLDPRQEGNYALGMDYFLDLTQAKRVYPMHCWEDYGIIGRWLDEHPVHPARDRIVQISGRGEEFRQ